MNRSAIALMNRSEMTASVTDGQSRDDDLDVSGCFTFLLVRSFHAIVTFVPIIVIHIDCTCGAALIRVCRAGAGELRCTGGGNPSEAVEDAH